MNMSSEITLSSQEALAIRHIIEREQDRILLKLRTIPNDGRVYLKRMLDETNVALLPFVEPEGR